MRRTTRQHIRRQLEFGQASATGLAEQIEDADAADVLEHIEHISRSLETVEEELLVSPPVCKDCGFDGFDKLLNIPSQCPDCRSGNIEEPLFKIR